MEVLLPLSVQAVTERLQISPGGRLRTAVMTLRVTCKITKIKLQGYHRHPNSVLCCSLQLIKPYGYAISSENDTNSSTEPNTRQLQISTTQIRTFFVINSFVWSRYYYDFFLSLLHSQQILEKAIAGLQKQEHCSAHTEKLKRNLAISTDTWPVN